MSFPNASNGDFRYTGHGSAANFGRIATKLQLGGDQIDRPFHNGTDMKSVVSKEALRNKYGACDWTGWTEWHSLKSLDRSKAPATPGAYVIAAEGSIHRAIGTDEDGFLDIGG